MSLAIISLLLFTSYVAYAVISIGKTPASLSDTYYELEKANRPRWLFQVAMMVCAFTLIPAWLDHSDGHIQFLPFLSCAGLLFVGVAPLFKLEFEGKVHYASAAICGGCAVLWLILSGMWYLPAICFLIALVLSYKYSKVMFWLEMAAFLSTYLGVIIKTLA